MEEQQSILQAAAEAAAHGMQQPFVCCSTSFIAFASHICLFWAVQSLSVFGLRSSVTSVSSLCSPSFLWWVQMLKLCCCNHERL